MQPEFIYGISVIDVQQQLTNMRFIEWLNNDVLQFRWWLLVVLFTASAYVWWRLVDKTRLNEIVLYTALITIVTLVLDELGEELALWDYPYDLVPIFPPLTAIDLSCLPMVYSLIYQYFRTWKSFVIATLAMAFLFCFILEPLFVWSGIYQTLTWKFYYGFPIYTAMAICAKAAVIRVYSIVANVAKT